MTQIPLNQSSADPESWVDEYAGPLFRYAMTQVGDPDVAEDLVQETFLAALRSHQSFAGRASFLTWLTSILRRKTVDYRRARARQGDQQQGAVEGESICDQLFDRRKHWRKTLGRWPANPGDQLESSEFWAIFERCVSQLPPVLGEAFRLREVMAWKMSDICELVGVSNGNLAVRLHRARLLMRGCLEEKWFKD